MRVPLYARILLWFMVNVAVLAAALALVMRQQLQHGLDSFMGNLIAARLQATAESVYQELSTLPVSRWDEPVRRLESDYGVTASLFRPPGRHFGGEKLDLPPAVMEELRVRLDGRRPRPADGMRPPPPPREFPNGPPPGAVEPGFPPEGPAPGEGPRRSSNAPVPARYAKSLLHTGEPRQYWALAVMPPPTTLAGPPEPLVLVIVAPSILTGGLLFDIRPWLIGAGAALAFSALLWLPVVRGITGKVKETMRATELMAEGKFDVRVKEDRHDELGRLAQGVNRMAEQLGGYVTGQRRFTGDIAHELCSPISRMQAALGILEVRAADEKQLQYIQTLSVELQHMGHLVQELLQFSKASIHRDIVLRDVPLAPLVQEIVDREAAGYPEGSVAAEIPSGLTVRAEPELLGRALGNILRNALRYAGCDGPVHLAAHAAGESVRLTVTDSGPGVPPEALPRLFDPFYRPDAARTRGHGGAGLGLAIVKSSIETCRGKVTAANREPRGLVVTVTLPAAAGSPAGAA